MSRQGKCVACQVHYVWPEVAYKLNALACPSCARTLQRTTHNSKLRLVTLHAPPVLRCSAVQAQAGDRLTRCRGKLVSISDHVGWRCVRCGQSWRIGAPFWPLSELQSGEDAA